MQKPDDGGADDLIQVFTIGTSEFKTVSVKKATPTSTTDLMSSTAAGEIDFRHSSSNGVDFYRVSPEAGTPRRTCEGHELSGGDGCVSISPDSRMIVVRKGSASGGRLVFRNIESGVERSLTPEAVSARSLGFSPDSRLFAFRSPRDGRDGVYIVPWIGRLSRSSQNR